MAIRSNAKGKKATTPAKSSPTKPAPKQAARKQPAPPAKKSPHTAPKPAKKAAAPTMKKYNARADLGKPIAGFFAKQSPALRAILEELRSIVESVVPEATAALKWGMPFYELHGAMMCALGAHKSHVNLILSGPPGSFDDPNGRLTGEGKTGKHLKLTRLEDIPRDEVRRWVAAAAQIARNR